MLLIVMYESQTWRIQPDQAFTFGRADMCSAVLPASDRGLSRAAGSIRFDAGTWWLQNDSGSSLLQLFGDRGFRVDLPPGIRTPLQQWHLKVQLNGVLNSYVLRIRLPDLDDAPDSTGADAGEEAGPGSEPLPEISYRPSVRAITSTRYRIRLTGSDRLVLTARFEQYLTWKHAGAPAPRTARQAAERIGWQPHAVAKRCENIRGRYARLGVPGLRGPRALEELAALLISTGELTPADLRLLPQEAPSSTCPET